MCILLLGSKMLWSYFPLTALVLDMYTGLTVITAVSDHVLAHVSHIHCHYQFQHNSCAYLRDIEHVTIIAKRIWYAKETTA